MKQHILITMSHSRKCYSNISAVASIKTNTRMRLPTVPVSFRIGHWSKGIQVLQRLPGTPRLRRCRVEELGTFALTARRSRRRIGNRRSSRAFPAPRSLHWELRSCCRRMRGRCSWRSRRGRWGCSNSRPTCLRPWWDRHGRGRCRRRCGRRGRQNRRRNL